MEPRLLLVLRWRGLAQGILRLVGVMSLAPAMFCAGSWLIEGIFDRDLGNLRYYFWRVLGAAWFAVWAVMGLGFSGWLSRMAFPLPRMERPARCPACGHGLVSLREGRCPECGIGLPAEFVRASHDGARAGVPGSE